MQPDYGTRVTSKDGVICKFPYDPTVAVMGYLSLAFLVASNVAGCFPLFYLAKSVPAKVLLHSTAIFALAL